MEKPCSRCEKVKPLSDFHRNGNGYKAACKDCRNKAENDSKRSEGRREYGREYQARLRKEQPERVKQKHQKYKETGGYQKWMRGYRLKKKQKRIGTLTYEEMLTLQGGGCAICGSAVNMANRDLAIDHDHATGQIRGLLCTYCNTGLGMFRDNPELLREAISYLEASKKLA